MSPSPDRIINMANAYFESCILFAVCDSGIFSMIAQDGPCNAEVLADRLHFDLRAVTKLADAATALRLLTKNGGLYHLTSESRAFLVAGQPGNLSGALRYNRDVYTAWGKLSDFLKTGKPVESPAIHLGDNPERTRDFVLSMHYRALGIGQIVVPLLDFAGIKKILDVGGGPGTFSVLIAQAYSEISSTVVDLPPIAEIARELVEKQGMNRRITVHGHDYHTYDFPAGQDAVLFFGVLHQESPDAIVALFRKASRALNPGGRIYVMDVMTDADHTAPAFSTFFSINMALTTNNGWVFSDEELKKWLEAAGFIEFSVHPVGGAMPHWLAQARVI